MLTFKRLTHTSDKLWDAAWIIYEESFPNCEKRLLTHHESMLIDDRFYCVAILDDNTVIGILFYWQWDTMIYIEHFALDSRFRGKRYGTTILNTFCNDDYTIVLEIEPPIDEVTISRFNFYKRLGFQMNDYFHKQPPYRLGEEAVILNLLSYKKTLTPNSYEVFEKFFLNEVMSYRDERL